jgi:hypothetical protein
MFLEKKKKPITHNPILIQQVQVIALQCVHVAAVYIVIHGLEENVELFAMKWISNTKFLIKINELSFRFVFLARFKHSENRCNQMFLG